MEHLKILFIDDSSRDTEKISMEIEKHGFKVISKRVNNHTDYVEAFFSFKPDIIISESQLSDFDGETALMMNVEKFGHIPFVFVSNNFDESIAPCLIMNGASDLVYKKDTSLLFPAILKALRYNELYNTYEYLLDKITEFEVVNDLIFNKFSDPLIWTDSESNKIIKSNESAEKLFQRNNSEMLDMQFANIFPDEYKLGSQVLYEIQKKHGEINNEIVEIKRKSGEVKRLLISATKAKYGNRDIFQWVFNDISEEINFLEMLEDNFIESLNLITSGMNERIKHLELINKSMVKKLSKMSSLEKIYKKKIEKLNKREFERKNSINVHSKINSNEETNLSQDHVFTPGNFYNIQDDGEIDTSQLESLQYIKYHSLNIVKKINNMLIVSKNESCAEEKHENVFKH